jgi:cytochrome c oxidase subunit 1
MVSGVRAGVAGPFEPAALPLARPQVWIQAYLGTCGLVFLLMMALGVLMRLAQAGAVALPPDWFYRVMTLHGVGMVGISGLAGVAIMWHFLARHVALHTGVLAANLVLFGIGVLMLFAPVLIAGYAGAWTFLYPLPMRSGGAWSEAAAALHLAGLLVVGVGFLLVHLETGRAILARYGNLGRALGWPALLGRAEPAPPPAVVASTMVLVVNTLGLAAGATVLVLSITSALVPSFTLDALLAKNLIFFFGHVFINASIYMSVIAVYEILPVYTGRPWKVTRVFLAAWSAALLMVMIVYPHHLFMDVAMPRWMLVMGQVISYASGVPVLVVTAFGAATLVLRSGIRWDSASRLAYVSVFGWAAGVVPAVVDGTLAVNRVMHNTLWVPGHFHFYLLLGLVPMVFAFMLFSVRRREPAPEPAVERLAFFGFTGGSLVLIFSFLAAGRHGVPRRWAVHLEPWKPYDWVGGLAGALVVLCVVFFAVRFVAGLRSAARDA